MIWLVLVTTVVAVAGVSYLFGKYWLGLTAFKGHLGSIRWSSYAGIPDWWHWAINPVGLTVGLALVAFTGAVWWSVALLPLLAAVCSAWANFDPGMHFTSAGFMFRLGPFTCGWNAEDTN